MKIVPAREKLARVLNLATRADRKKARAKLGPLTSLRIAAQTRNRYAQAWLRFRHFCWERELHVNTVSAFDMALSYYIECLWQEGEPKPWSADAVAAAQYYVPCLKRSLNLAWSLCSAWNRLELPTRALPFDPDTLVAFCGGLLRAGFARIAAGSILGFNILSRTGELLTLTRSQVQLGKDESVVVFSQTKRGQRLGIDEPVVIRDPSVLLVLRFLCAGLEPGDTLLQCSEKQLRSAYAHVSACLDLQRFACRPYSLRRGGATTLFRATGSLDVVALRGRWGAVLTARRYIDDGVATMASIAFSPWQSAQFAVLGSELREWLRELESRF
jgi:hypothetical protein